MLRWADLGRVVTDAICVYTNYVAEEVGLFRITHILQKFKRRLKILRVSAAVKKKEEEEERRKLIASATRHPEFLQPFHRTCV